MEVRLLFRPPIDMYKLLKPIFFLFEPEFVHDRIVHLGQFLGRLSLTRKLVGSICRFEHPSLRIKVAGIDFANPVGLAAGFDKDMYLTQILPEVGFGFMEVGSVTHLPFAGNPGRRLLRLPEDKSLIVYYGLKNIGAEAILKKRERLSFNFPVGLSIAKTNRPEIMGDSSIIDYIATYRLLANKFDYVTINVSCPNALAGCSFQDPILLDRLLAVLSREAKVKPIFLKISVYLTHDDIDAILSVVEKYNFVDGFVIGNLHKRRSQLNLKTSTKRSDLLAAGGISGAPIRDFSDELIRYVYSETNGRYVIIGSGGVFSAEDAYRKIKLGASLVQLVTGMIYEGPTLIKRINRDLVELLSKDGLEHISEAIGRDVKLVATQPKTVEPVIM
jgi:dihydroorotate dehydrogenase